MKSIVVPVLLFIFTMAITPGPNNMLLTASGAKFGYRKTFPVIIGIMTGMLSQLLLSIFGLSILFEKLPLFHTGLKIVGTLYIFYLAIKIAFFSTETKEGRLVEKPLVPIQGAALQYVNPKAYIMAVTTISVYPLKGELYIPSVLFIAAAYVLIPFVSISLWACFGSFLNRWMTEEKRKKKISYFLGILTAASAIFIII